MDIFDFASSKPYPYTKDVQPPEGFDCQCKTVFIESYHVHQFLHLFQHDGLSEGLSHVP
jgi:hypothetical protein